MPSPRAPEGQRRAEPRTGPAPRPGDGSRVYGYGSRYNNYNYYPRRSYPYGYGAFGLGYFYYDPYYYGGYYGGYYGSPYYGYGYPAYGYGYPSYPAYGDGYATGEVRLDVHPRDAEVYVNGYYAGRVDDFDGYFQGLKLEEGGYHISIVAPGYEPLEFDLRITAGHKTTYRGNLLRNAP